MRTASLSSTRTVVIRNVLAMIVAGLTGYLAAVAAWPQVHDLVPEQLRWFGAPNSAVTMGIVVIAYIALAVVLVRASGGRRGGTPVAIVLILAIATTLLGVASYWRCQDETHPDFFTPLLWTAALLKGGDPARSLADGSCPSPMPVALNIAQLSALAALFTSVAGVALALFRSQFDRLRLRLSRSVTVAVGGDDDASSLVAAIAHTMGRTGTLVVVVGSAETDYARRARTAGACIVAVDLDDAEQLLAVPVWDKLDRLYLLAPDPSTNLLRLRAVTARGGDERLRIPLVVRIDDPWQAAAWRAQHFGGAHNRWAADTVGLYEVTARRLLDRTLTGPRVDRLFVCGSSQLTTALCADMLTRRLEAEYLGDDELPVLHVLAPDATQYQRDYAFTATQMGHADREADIVAVDEAPSVATLLRLVGEGDAQSTALIFADSTDYGSTATRIAARLPDTTIHVHDHRADATRERVSVVGRLYTYRLSLDLPGGQAHDAWERAAILIHRRYVAESGATGPAAEPWEELGEFYRESNRRQVRNALWMVEKIGGHTWNTWGKPPDGVSTVALRGLQPQEQLRQLGFDLTTATAMARAEHEDWCRYYRRHGWRHGPRRDDRAKVHDKLIDWTQLESDPAMVAAALRSLAATLTKLRELGYRSHSDASTHWERFRRAGAVIAEQRATAWTWTAHDGSTMHAAAGDWEVREESGTDSWSVRDDIFRATHRHIGGNRWRRLGTVLARPANDGESVRTLEGTITAPPGSWIVQGDHGDVWAVPGDEFTRRYALADHNRSNPGGK
ncbi:hypothetical protein [Mycolicibacterium gilvum]|uniref:hypothetical protein n=1 Tax=Mycolicibacterium gilvum TaxID=1804 RepID=UPI000E1B9525|nr:hypothetical protein [Mycolicibacterium gilvum]MCV7054330.1 hypothetical protein [Mycolicibacterium gilvum]